jgi:hypothetical protein
VFQVFLQAFQVFLQVFQLFWTYVASVSLECFKSRSGCYTCCNMPHLPQPSTTVPRASCMRMGNKGIERYSVVGRGSGGRWR